MGVREGMGRNFWGLISGVFCYVMCKIFKFYLYNTEEN